MSKAPRKQSNNRYSDTPVDSGLLIERRMVEERFIGSAYNNPAAALEDFGWMQPDMFIDEINRKFWAALLAEKDSTKAALASGDIAAITEASFLVASAFELSKYGKKMVELKYLSGVIDGLLDIVSLVGERNTQEVKSKLEALSAEQTGSESNSFSPAEVHYEFSWFVHDLLSGGGTVRTFIPELDTAIGGFMPSELTIVASRPGMGKTALTWQIARNVALNGGIPIYFSLEMDRMQLWARSACSAANLSWTKVRSGGATNDEIKRLYDNGADLAAKMSSMVVVDNAFTLPQIHQACLMHKPTIVFVDNLSEIHWFDMTARDNEWFGKGAKFLRDNIAKAMRIPVILVHHINRDVEGRPDKRPLMSDLRMDGTLEQFADNVLMLYRDDYYNGTGGSTAPVPLEVLIRKYRQGVMNSSVILSYDLRSQYIE